MKIANHGSIVLLTPETDAEREFFSEHVQTEDWQWWGDALACEPRYVQPILEAIEALS